MARRWLPWACTWLPVAHRHPAGAHRHPAGVHLTPPRANTRVETVVRASRCQELADDPRYVVDIGTAVHEYTSTRSTKCFSLRVTTAAASSRACVAMRRSASRPSPVGRPARRCSAQSLAADRQVAVVMGTYWISRVSSSSL